MSMHNPAHPGELLQGWLSDLELGVAQTAAHLGIGRVTLSRILHGHAAISADVDLRLSEALGTSPGSWLRMQAARDAWKAKELAKVRPKIPRLSGSVSETLYLLSSHANAAKLAKATAQDKAGNAKRRKYSAADLGVMQGKTPVMLDAQWGKMATMCSESPL